MVPDVGPTRADPLVQLDGADAAGIVVHKTRLLVARHLKQKYVGIQLYIPRWISAVSVLETLPT